MGIISSLGVEIEFTDLDQDRMINFIRKHNIHGASIVNDASCTRSKLTIGDIGVTDDMLRNNPLANSWATRKILGGEFVSSIIYSDRDDNKWFNPVGSVLKYMADSGEKPSLAAGIHIHVNVGGYKNVNIEFLHGLTKIWQKVEAAIYRLTSGEMKFSRGAEQLSYCYYRPLVPKDGPVVVRNNHGHPVSVFDINKLLKTQNVEEFFKALGRSDISRGHYWATKYHGLNFQSVITKGTVELRTGNFTNQPRYLYAWIRMFQTMMAVAWASYAKPLEIDNFPDLPLGYNGNFDLSEFLKIVPIQESEVIDTLSELWDITKWSPEVKGYQWSHLGHGLGARMNETILDFSGLRKELIPNPLRSETIHRPEEFAKDKSVTALRNFDNGAETTDLDNRPRIRTLNFNEVRINVDQAEQIFNQINNATQAFEVVT